MSYQLYHVYSGFDGAPLFAATIMAKRGPFRELKDELINAGLALESDVITMQINGESYRLFKDDESIPEQRFIAAQSTVLIRPRRQEKDMQLDLQDGKQIISLLSSIESHLRDIKHLSFHGVDQPSYIEKIADDEKDPPTEASQSMPNLEPSPINGEYTWEIKNVDRLPAIHLSEVFYCAGHYWQMKVMPSGNGEAHKGYFSAYLLVPDSEGAQSGPRQTKFEFSLLNRDSAKHHTRSTEHKFKEGGGDWGWNQFALHGDIKESASGFLHSDLAIRLKVKMTVSPF